MSAHTRAPIIFPHKAPTLKVSVNTGLNAKPLWKIYTQLAVSQNKSGFAFLPSVGFATCY